MLRNIPGADTFCIALVILPICIVPTVISERFKPHVHPAPKVEFVIAKEERLSLRWSCDTIRSFAEGKSKEQLEDAAKARGLTAKERAEAVACLKKDKRV